MSKEKIFKTLAGFVFISLVFASPSLGIDFTQKPTRLGEGQATTVAFNPDGTLLAASHRTDPESDIYSTQVVILWDPQTQEQVSILEIAEISYVTFSPDGSLLALGGGDDTIRLWDVAGQNQVGLMQSPTRWGLSCLAFSPDGKTLASSGSGSTVGGTVICLWDVQTKQQLCTLSGHRGQGINSIVFSPDGRFLVSGGHREDETIRVWDVATQQQVGELFGHLDVTYDLAFSPDGSLLASAGGWYDKAIYLWDARTWEQVGVLGGLSAHVLSIAFSPSGERLVSTVNSDNTVHVWDVEMQEQEGIFEDHDAIDSGTISHVAFSSDGKWLACGSENGIELWELNLQGTIPQTNAFGPKPYNDAVHMDTWVSLEWIPGDFAVSHDVYLGDNYDQVSEATPDSDVFRGNQIATFFVAGLPGYAYPDGLVPGTTYYWRIDEVNDTAPNSPWKGSVWSFTIQPRIACDPVPADGAESVDVSVELSWRAGLGATLHAVYFGDNFDEVNNATGGLKQVATTYTPPGPLEFAKTYYWRVDELRGARGGETYKGDIWSFTTPGAVGNPHPAYGVKDIEMNATLTWRPADSAVSHQLYFGTDKEAVRTADTGSPEYMGPRALGTESYEPGLLEANTTYCWRVDEVNVQGNTAKGPLWTFTTGAYLLVDDFENYTDDDPNNEAIWQSWIDGFGIPDNGAQVGYLLPPYAEQTIVHGGTQSMPLFYFNVGGVTNSEVTLTLTAVRDWTLVGVAELSLWFRGDSANATEPLYVAISNSGGAPSVVAYDDASAVANRRWTQWTISLQAFSDLDINLTNVDKLAIGLGSKSGMVAAGGSGTIYIDDIRLYRPTP